MRRIAIMMPVYNEEKLLPITLGGIIDQSLKPTRLFIGNGSSDSSASVARDILQESGLEYEIVDVARIPRIGKWNINNAYSVLSRLVEKYASEIDYVATIEADVLLERAYFSKLVESFEKDPNLQVASGRLDPWGLPDDPFPFEGVSCKLWGANRVYRVGTWFELGNMIDVRCLPAWDTDHMILATQKGCGVRFVPDAASKVLREVNPFGGEPKGVADCLHGLPLWWALPKSVENRDWQYLLWYLLTRLYAGTRVPVALKDLQRTYRRAALEVFTAKLTFRGRQVRPMEQVVL